MSTTWISTHTGIRFDLAMPHQADVNIRDIAHALGNLCRFGGHCSNFYSVAEHSIHVSRLVPKELAMQGLLHDATEAYCVDVPTPLKTMLTTYSKIEDRIWKAIAKRFGLPRDLHPEVKLQDARILLAEYRALMATSPPIDEWFPNGKGLTRPDVKIEGLDPVAAEKAFLQRFQELT